MSAENLKPDPKTAEKVLYSAANNVVEALNSNDPKKVRETMDTLVTLLLLGK